jgi:hypothetical protein
MKKILISILFFSLLISCNKNPGELKYSETIAGGCAAGKGVTSSSDVSSETDKVTYLILNGNLELTVGFNATCCGQYSTTAEIEGDTITIRIVTIQAGICNCICYYTYDFKFTGSGKNYRYKVTIDEIKTFTGEISR